MGGGAGAEPSASAEAVFSDARGHFTLSVPHGWVVRLTGTARGFLRQSYEQHENFSSLIAVTDVAPDVAITFRLQPEAVISGLVRDEAGEAVRGAQVRVQRMFPDEEGGRRTEAAAKRGSSL